MPEPDEGLDANAEFERLLAEGPATPPPVRAPKAPPAPLTDADRERLRSVESGRAEAAEMERRRALEPEMRETGFVGDAFRGLMPTEGGSRARERQTERVRNLWDQIVLGDARYGGRNPTRPIVGLDRRMEAPVAGVADTAALGLVDEVGGAARAALTDETYDQARDEIRGRARAAREQAPQLAAAGQALGSVPLMALGGGGTLAGSAATSGLVGGVGAFGASEANLDEDPGQLAWDTLVGAGQSALAGGAANLGARAIRAAGGARPDLSRLADDATIAASGPGALRGVERADRARTAAALRETGAIPRASGPMGTEDSIRRALERTTDPGQRTILQQALRRAEEASDELVQEGLHTRLDPRALYRDIAPRVQASVVGGAQGMAAGYPRAGAALTEGARRTGRGATGLPLPAFLRAQGGETAAPGDESPRSFEAEFLADQEAAGAPEPGSFEAEFLAEPKPAQLPAAPAQPSDEDLQALFESLESEEP